MYIQGQLGKGQYEEHSDNVINLWKKNYSQSQEFTSKTKAEAAYSNALRFFPSSAVVLHKNFVNNYILTVKKPVNNVKITVQDIIGRETKDAQELADFKLINSEQGNSAYEQFAIEQSPTALMQWEKDVLPEILTHMENMLLPIKYRADMEKFFKEHPNSFIQQALEQQQEIQLIKEQAIANGTFMKAPNGKPTNLTEKQWLQVRTKNFINWFGDWINDPQNASKIVDENGEPLVVYHGSAKRFKEFDANKIGSTTGDNS
jgi:hypothetical protein